jgi:DNA-binding transcriptional LysR family regulator
MLDLKRLRVLREVAEQGSFSAAAESLFVSQSAVSQQIAALEAEVGVPLLVRLRTGPVLTEAGELLVSHADAAICRLEHAERELAELAGLETGEVRVASFPSASGTLVVTAASAFRRRHPEVKLSIAEGEPETSIPELKRGRHDLAVVYDFELTPFEEDRDLELAPLLAEQMHVIVPKDHRLAERANTGIRLEELESEPWLCGAGDGSCRNLTLRSCELAGFEPDVSFESNDYTVLQSLVAAGMGVTLLPDLALSSLNPGVTLIPVVPEPPVRRVWAATLQAGSRSAATEAMLEVLIEAGRARESAVAAAA